MLLEAIFNRCDNARRQDVTEEALLDELENQRRLMRRCFSAGDDRWDRYLQCEELASAYVERAYFYEGFRAAVSLIRECGPDEFWRQYGKLAKTP